jgi:hypothetical protein
VRTERRANTVLTRQVLTRQVLTGLPALLLLALLPAASAAADLRATEGTNLSVDVSPADGSLAMDLLGNLWRVPPGGGDAERLTDSLLPARRPRYSPDGREILYQIDAPAGPQLWRLDIESGNSSPLSRPGHVDRQGDWHPDGTRIVFASQRGDSGLDLWEMDLASGLQWRISSLAGDESAPAWSANGRHLTFVLHRRNLWQLMLRRYGQPPESLLVSDTPLHAPSWRPDGTLITYLREIEGRLELRMAILSDPPLQRTLVSGEDLFLAPVSWRDRERLYYAADGTIKTRDFDDWKSARLRFSASVARPGTRPQQKAAPARQLPEIALPKRELVIRAARLYDGHDPRYRRQVDIIVKDGRIEGVEEQRDRGDAFILDLGDVTAMPGLIDVYSPMPAGALSRAGAGTLAFGVTTLVVPDAGAGFDADAWESEQTPGPRLLRATSAGEKPGSRVADELRLAVIDNDALAGNDLLPRVRDWQQRGVPVLAQSWSIGLGLGADLLLGAAVLPASPGGHHYQDVSLLSGNGPIALVTALADATTPGQDTLRQSRQAKALPGIPAPARRFAATPRFEPGDVSLVVGSRPSGLPAGLSTQAELRALRAAGLSPAATLYAATGAAAAMLGLNGQVGHIVAGARADLLLIGGDPLRDVDDALNIVAVVRNGRLYSLSSLLERAAVD